ncbi:unnamed protein product [Caenorhabditis auriculariae]|uniref:F-box domain-containing protein n=1 Tax=Caenorhabditis auriculariae TaxID=2777116 RepID=A0A8S1GXG9_9PELO|nr:unnamed protein product [Caenorhabditis auriculariae]
MPRSRDFIDAHWFYSSDEDSESLRFSNEHAINFFLHGRALLFISWREKMANSSNINLFRGLHDISPSNSEENEVMLSTFEVDESLEKIFNDSFYERQENNIRTLHMRPDVVSTYRTPGVFKFRRRTSMEPRIDYFNHYPVPDHIIQDFLSLLNKRDLCSAMRTCRRFAMLASSSNQWKATDLGGKTISDAGLVSILNRRSSVIRLCASQVTIFRSRLMPQLMLQSPLLLTHLDLSGTMFDDPSLLVSILHSCNQLRCLSLENQKINDIICHLISKNRMMAFLDLSMTTGISSSGAEAICESCRGLRELNVSWSSINFAAVQMFCAKLPPSLTALNMAGTLDKSAITDVSVGKLVKSCPNLRDLDLSDNNEITEVSLIAITKELRSLEILSLNRCYSINPVHFCTHCKTIRSLNIHGCVVGERIESMAMSLPHTQINKNLLNYTAKAAGPAHSTRIWGQRVSDLY